LLSLSTKTDIEGHASNAQAGLGAALRPCSEMLDFESF
jgi:hypothetical protein